MTEKQIAAQARSRLKGDLLSKIGSQYKELTGESRKDTTVRSRFSKGRLIKLVVKAPKYMFIQNFGFEGTKKGGIYMRLQAKRTIDDAIRDTNIITYLADEISIARAEEVVASFRNI